MVEPSEDHELSNLAPVSAVSSPTASNTTTTEEDQSENDANSSSTTAHEHNLTVIIKHLPSFMKAARRNARKAQNKKKAQKKKARKVKFDKACTTIAFILTVIGLGWGVYSVYHWSGPANVISQEGLDAAELANYYTYIFTVCPSLQAQNMSTPECDATQNQTMPAPKKPSTVGLTNPAQIAARQLMPFINGSLEFEAIFHESDSYCFQGSQHTLEEPERSQLPCPMLNLSIDVWPSTISPSLSRSLQRRTTFQNIALIPLPPSLGARHVPASIYWMDVGTQALSVILFIYVYIILWRRPRLQYLQLSLPAPLRDVLDRPTSRLTGLSQYGGLVQIRVVGSFYFCSGPLDI